MPVVFIVLFSFTLNIHKVAQLDTTELLNWTDQESVQFALDLCKKRRSPGGGHGNPLQYSFLRNPMDRGTWQAIVHCREPAREIPPMTRSCRTRGTPWAIQPMTRSCRRVLISKASGLDGPPGSAWASIPKPESVCLIILCLSPTLLTLAGGCPRPKS